MKDFSIEIGGAVRVLRFTSKDGIALHKRFGRSLNDLAWHGLLGYVDGVQTADFDPEVQIAILTAGIVRGGARVDEDLVTQWFDEHLAAGKLSGDLLWPALKAMLYSGIVGGKKRDLDEEVKEVLGKVPAAPATPAETPTMPE